MGVWNMPFGKSKGPVKKVSAKMQENTVNMHDFLDVYTLAKYGYEE